MNILNIELSKPFNKQTFTPTQILNDYIKNYVKDRNKIENYEAIKTVSVEARPIFLKEVLKKEDDK